MISGRQFPKLPKAQNSGFTLIETIIVVALFAIMIVAIFGLFDYHAKIYKYQEALVRVSGSARSALNAIQFYTLQAHAVLASQTVNGTAYTSNGSSTMILQLPALNGSGNIISNTWDYVVFHVNGANLIETIQADPASSRNSGDVLLSDSLQSIVFTYDNNSFPLVGKVTLSLQTTQQLVSGTVSFQTEGTFSLRNH